MTISDDPQFEPPPADRSDPAEPVWQTQPDWQPQPSWQPQPDWELQHGWDRPPTSKPAAEPTADQPAAQH